MGLSTGQLYRALLTLNMSLRLFVLAVVVLASVEGKGVPLDLPEEVEKIKDDISEAIVNIVTPNEVKPLFGAGIIPGTETMHGGEIISEDEISVGTIIYSVLGFTLGGLLLFVSIFDPTRLAVIQFFDSIFGKKDNQRRRRDVAQELEARVNDVFSTFTSALDKMALISKVSK